MICRKLPLIAVLGLLVSAHANANTATDSFRDPQVRPGAELPPYLQCVPYARERSGLQIYGDAYTWWDQANGKYSRGNVPKKGAVMAFAPSGNMELGHVAVVAKIVDSRTVLLDHANWSPIEGRRGQIERGVMAIDTSSANDWSTVRVWYDPIQQIGTTNWPLRGFIYPQKAKAGGDVFAVKAPSRPLDRADGPKRNAPSKAFSEAFAGMTLAGQSAGKTPAAKSQMTAPQQSRSSQFGKPQSRAIMVSHTPQNTAKPRINSVLNIGSGMTALDTPSVPQTQPKNGAKTAQKSPQNLLAKAGYR